MPVAKVGQKLNNIDRKSKFISLESKDQKFLLRFTGGYSYEGRHFQKLQDGKYKVEDCFNINSDAYCETCELYKEAIKPTFELRKQMKVETDEEKKAVLKARIDKILKDARDFKVTVNFYYPVLKRVMSEGEQPEVTIFKTTLSVRLKLDDQVANGVNVPNFDYIVRRTEQPGASYYSLDRVDSSETKPLSEEEQKMFEEAKSWDLETLTQGKKGSSTLETEQEEPLEVQQEKAEAEGDAERIAKEQAEAEQPTDEEIADDIPF